jgi:hypothetical protein
MFNMKDSQQETRLRFLIGLVVGAVPLRICVMVLFMMQRSVESFQPIARTPTTANERSLLSSSSSWPATLSEHYTQQGYVRHPHDGVAIPWLNLLDNNTPPLASCVQLDAQAEKTLARGKPYRTMAHFEVPSKHQQQQQQQLPSKTISRRLIVQDVEAPVQTIIDRILDYNQYARMVPGISQSEIYHRETIETTCTGSLKGNTDEGSVSQRLGVHMKAGVPFMQFEFYTDIRYDPNRRTISWTLDYSRHSQVYESVGMWYIQPRHHHTNNDFNTLERNDYIQQLQQQQQQQQQDSSSCWSRVYYAAEHTLFKSAPKQVQYLINQSSLKDGVSCCLKQRLVFVDVLVVAAGMKK